MMEPLAASSAAAAAMYNNEYAGETQGATQQASQYASYYGAGHPMESPFFGCLQPCHTALRRIDFQKARPHNTVGRGPANDFVLPGMRISYHHCQIIWDGREDRQSQVVVHDNSTNGTWINGMRVQKGQSRILRDGNEIAFGSPMPQENPVEDYRYIYRHLAPLELTGIHAHYDMAHELGRGTFATVMRAMSRETGEWFAVKIIHGNKVRPTSAAAHAAVAVGNGDNGNGGSHSHSNNNHNHQLQAFGREISILETLNHPNICRLRETFVPDEKDHDFYLVLELVEGGDLLDYILAHDGLSEPIAQHITRQMCDALSYIHAKGITHRDLKPENVLLTRDDPPNVKVADFGLAKVVDSLTMLRTMCGTPSYLAPEVVNQGKANQGYDHLVDSWSVGVIVFSMLTNTGPFIEDENEVHMHRRIATRYIDWSALRIKHISAPAQNFIRRLLDSDPATRMTLTDALHHPWLNPSVATASTSTDAATTAPTATAASQNAAIDRTFSEVSALSELPDDGAEFEMDDAQMGGADEGDVSMLSAAPSVDDMPGVDSLNITSPARLRARPPLERRSQVLARELAAEADADARSKNNTKNGSGGGKRPRPGSSGVRQPGSGSPVNDVAMADGGGDEDRASAGTGAGAGTGGGKPRAAKRGRRSGGDQSKSPSPPSGSGSGSGNGTGRTLRSRNAGAAGPTGGARR